MISLLCTHDKAVVKDSSFSFYIDYVKTGMIVDPAIIDYHLPIPVVLNKLRLLISDCHLVLISVCQLQQKDGRLPITISFNTSVKWTNKQID